MRLLLDTHVALWSVNGDPKLSKAARATIVDAADAVFVSVMSVWEIAIKHALREGRRDAVALSGREAVTRFEDAGFAMLPVKAAQAAAIDDLPRLHADPFDRMLVAQARHEPLRLLTHDKALAAYGSMVMLV